LAPSVLPAPARFSTTIGRPSSGVIASAMMRATMSDAPAAATGTIMRIGLSPKSDWAPAAKGRASGAGEERCG
jgi:hypothetical protein